MEKRTQIGVKLDPEQVERIDAYRGELDWPVSRTAVIERAIDDYLEREAQRVARNASKEASESQLLYILTNEEEPDFTLRFERKDGHYFTSISSPQIRSGEPIEGDGRTWWQAWTDTEPSFTGPQDRQPSLAKFLEGRKAKKAVKRKRS